MTEVFNQEEISETKTCEKHGDYFVKKLLISGRYLTMQTCPGCKKDIETARVTRLELEKIQTLKNQRSERHAKSRVPIRFKESRFDNFIAKNEAQQKAVDICRAYASNWQTVKERGMGLILSGKAGTGKTHLACSIAHEFIEQGGMAVFSTVAEMMRQIKSSFAKDSDSTEQQMIDHFSGIQLLILDEVGMDYGTEFNKALIFEVLNKRYENVLPTILLTNLDTSALREYIGERLIDRMRSGGGKLISFTWDSYRGQE